MHCCCTVGDHNQRALQLVEGITGQPESILHTVRLKGIRFLQKCTIGDCRESMEEAGVHKRFTAEGICHYIFRARNVPDVKVIRGQFRHPPLLTGVQFWFTENVCERVIVGPYSELVTSQPVTEFVAHSPLKCEEFQPVCWIARLGIIQRLAGKCNGPSNTITIRQLRQHSPEAVGRGIHRQEKRPTEVGVSKSDIG